MIVIYGAVYDLVVELLETIEIGFECEWFGVSGEGCCCFDNDEVVDVVLVFVHANLEPIEFGVDEDEVVDLTARSAVGVSRPIEAGTKRFGILNGQVPCR